MVYEIFGSTRRSRKKIPNFLTDFSTPGKSKGPLRSAAGGWPRRDDGEAPGGLPPSDDGAERPFRPVEGKNITRGTGTFGGACPSGTMGARAGPIPEMFLNEDSEATATTTTSGTSSSFASCRRSGSGGPCASQRQQAVLGLCETIYKAVPFEKGPHERALHRFHRPFRDWGQRLS